MANIRDIKTRIVSVREISKITRAMKMVSTAKYKKAMRFLDDGNQYVQEVESLLIRVSTDVVYRYNPYFSINKNSDKELLIVVTADKGLCGSFNTNLIRSALQKINGSTDLFIIGKRGRSILEKKHPDRIFGVTVDLSEHDLFKRAIRTMLSVKQAFLNGKYREVKIIYNHFESLGRLPLVCEQLLPLPKPDPLNQKSQRSLMLEPSPDAVFNHLMDHYIDLKLFKILLESQLAEHITRMNAMEAATKNADELINQLVLSYNRARQALITTELLEVVNGAEALKQ